MIEVTPDAKTTLIPKSVEFLKELLTNMGLEVTIEPRIKENQIILDMDSNNNSILIGRDGKTLKALQNILRKYLYKKEKINVNIILNVGNYQQQREENLIRLAKKLAKDVKITKNPIELDAMNSYERLIIHNALKDDKELITTSTGEEPNRHVVIQLKED